MDRADIKKTLYNHINVFDTLKNQFYVYEFLDYTKKLIEIYKLGLNELNINTISFEVLEEIIKNNTALKSMIESFLKTVLDKLVKEFEFINKK